MSSFDEIQNRSKFVFFCTHESHKQSVYQMEYMVWCCETKGVLQELLSRQQNGHPTVICMCSLKPAACENTKALLATTNIPFYNPFLPFFFSRIQKYFRYPYHITLFVSTSPTAPLVPPPPSHIYCSCRGGGFFFFFFQIQFIHRLACLFRIGVALSLWAFIIQPQST